MIAQAVLGGVRVLVGIPRISATAHAILAQVFFLTIVGLSLYLSPWWQRDLPQLEEGSSGAAGFRFWTTACDPGSVGVGRRVPAWCFWNHAALGGSGIRHGSWC